MTRQTGVMSDRNGFSLIEMLVAIAILAIVATALMQSSLIVIQRNIQSELREDAVRFAEQTMNSIRSSPGGFDGIDPSASHLDLFVEDYTFPAVSRVIRGTTVPYTIRKVVIWLDTNNKQVTVTVSWAFGGQTYNHSILSIVRRYGS